MNPDPPTSPDSAVGPVTSAVVGMLGGVAAGKSTVARSLAEAGFRILDADQIAHRLYAEDKELRRGLSSEFGADVLTPTGVDRQALGRRVFDDPSARRRLEAMVHPAVHDRLLQDLRDAAAEGVRAVLDVPLLLESGWESHCDSLIFVETAEATREARALARGWADGDRMRREAVQTPLEEKRAAADFVWSGADTARSKTIRAEFLEHLAERLLAAKSQSTNADEPDDKRVGQP